MEEKLLKGKATQIQDLFWPTGHMKFPLRPDLDELCKTKAKTRKKS